MIIRLQSFAGEFPVVHPVRLADNKATISENTDFSGGVVMPLHGITPEIDLPPMSGDVLSVFLHYVDDVPYWLQFSGQVDVITSPIKDDEKDRVYWTGDGREGGEPLFSYAPILYTGGAPFPSQYRKLGIPAPTNTPIASLSSPAPLPNDPAEVRTYVYTFVTDLGEESPPSLASSPITVKADGAQVLISGLSVPAGIASGRSIDRFRIYRSAVGSTGGALFRLLTEIPIIQTSFSDSKGGVELTDELSTASYDAPRLDMRGLGLTAYGVAYGFVGKIVCMSYPFLVYAWPRDFELTTQYDIVAIGHYDSNIVVGTKGSPVIITGIDPIGGMTMTELPIHEACVSKRSMVSMGYAVIYASPNGLVMASSSGARLITSSFFNKDEWNRLNPSSIHAVEHRGKYMFFWRVSDDERGAYLFDPNNLDQGLIRLGIYCIAAFRDSRSDTLYLLQDDGKIERFDDLARVKLPFVWRSKLFRAPSAAGSRMLAAQVVADSYDNLQMKVIADGDEIFINSCLTEKPFRLPNHSHKKDWQVEISGTDVVRELVLASTMREVIS